MNKKLLGLLVASVGSVAAVCTSLALYISAPDDVGFTVGISTDTDVAYTITEQEVETNNTTINPDQGLSVEYKLGATLGDNYTQLYVTGRLTVTVSGNEDTLKYLQGGMKLTYEQTPGDENASTYFFNKEDQTTFNTLTLAPVAEGDYSSLTGVLNATIDGTSGTKAVLSLGLTEDGITNFLSVAESELTINISFTKVGDDYQSAYLVGDMNGWAEEDAYRMVPNIYSSTGFEWMWKGNSTLLPEGTEFKGKIGGTYSHNGANQIAPANVDTIYWGGGVADAEQNPSNWYVGTTTGA